MNSTINIGNWTVLRFPFVPNFAWINFPPKLHRKNFICFDVQRFSNRKEHREPAEHSLSMRFRVYADLDVFVQMRTEIPSEAVNQTIDLCCKVGLSIAIIMDDFVSIGMVELPDFLRVVNVINVAKIHQPICLHMLVHLTNIFVSSICHDRTNVSDRIGGNANAIRFQEFLCTIKAFRTEFIILE